MPTTKTYRMYLSICGTVSHYQDPLERGQRLAGRIPGSEEASCPVPLSEHKYSAIPYANRCTLSVLFPV